MAQSQTLVQQINDGIGSLGPDFGDHLWLTFYLSGQEESLAILASQLAEAGWVNVDGSDSGFIYPKKHVRKIASEAVQVALTVDDLCRLHRVEILNVDADTSADVQASKFVMLFRA